MSERPTLQNDALADTAYVKGAEVYMDHLGGLINSIADHLGVAFENVTERITKLEAERDMLSRALALANKATEYNEKTIAELEAELAAAEQRGLETAALFMESQVDSEWSVFYVANKIRKLKIAALEDTYDSQPSPPWPKKEDTHE